MKKAVLSLALVAGIIGSAHAQLNKTNLTLCGASPGGMWSLVGTGIDAAVRAGFPGSSTTYQTSSGGPANVMQVMGGKCDIGIANDGDLAAAANGQKPFKQPLKGAQAIGVMFNWLPVMWIARKDFADKYGIRDLNDLAVKKPPVRIAFNRRGLLTSDITETTLTALGVSVADIKKWGGSIQYQGSEEQSSLMQDGRVDVIANTIFEGHRSLAEMAMATELVMLQTPQKAADAAIKQHFLKPWTIKANAHPWQKQEVKTVTTSIILFAAEKMSEKTVYDLTKALIQNADKLRGVSKAMEPFQPKVLVDQHVVPFHPGAIRAYKEAGLM
jgi:TRAP transporter TAXI family solute receptor